MMANVSDIDPPTEASEKRAPHGLRLTLAAVALALAAICGFLWMRFGAQVFLDAALFAWRACF